MLQDIDRGPLAALTDQGPDHRGLWESHRKKVLNFGSAALALERAPREIRGLGLERVALNHPTDRGENVISH
jgi:hypothetical protein